MALDIKFKDDGVAVNAVARTYQTEAGATDITSGQPVKLKSAGSNYVIPLADGDGVVGTTTDIVGFAKSDSDHTAAADGTIEVYRIPTGARLIMKAKDSTAIDTQSEIDALQNKHVVFDLTASTYTVDTAAAHNDVNAIVIQGGDRKSVV